MAVKAASHPRYIELPVFSGNHQEWLMFRSAYNETATSFTKFENINRLRRNLKGKASEAVEGLLISNSDPADVMRALESRFGKPEAIAIAELNTLKALPRLTENPQDTCTVSSKITNAVCILQALSCAHFLFNPETSKILLDKLTPTLRHKFYEFAAKQPREDPDLLKMEKFMKTEADLCAPYAQPEPVGTQAQPTSQYKRTYKVHTVTEEQQTTAKCAVCDNTGHTATDCEKFKNADSNARWDIAKNKHLCFRCLRYRSRNHSCKRRTCDTNGCKYYHHKLLHFVKKTEPAKEKETTEAVTTTWTATQKQSYLKIIPIQVKGPTATIDTYALLDDGSTVTLIDSNISDKIGATGPIDPLRIEAINKMKTAETQSRRVSFVIKGLNNHEEPIQARTVMNLQVSTQEVPKEQIEKCEHLRDLSRFLTYENAKPRVLIGQDNWHLLLTSKIRRGDKNQPVASLTPLGWVLHGNHTRSLGRSIDFVSHITEAREEDNLEEMMKQYFATDALCLNAKKPSTDPEETALRILIQNTVHTEEGRYETSLLWKKEDFTFPDNYENTLKRLYGIEKKLDRDPKLKEKYTEQMEALITKKYAEPAPKEKTPGKTWYLPHFAVINPMKPDKLRVVHDAAAKTKGVALNDALLKGPDLLQSLPGVMMRFRQHKIAVTADIGEMFMQVKLRKEDRDALRYLWRRDRRDDKPPEEYRMTSLIFGASSSPSTAIFVKNLNAEANQQTHPEAAIAIKEKHYVDDYLDSFRTIEDAIRITKGVRDVHQKAHFILKQWKSNSTKLLEALGEQKASEDAELYETEQKTERVLGLVWKPEEDKLTFNLNLNRVPPQIIEGKRPTKREALKVVMSLFDPLGYASPVTARAKQILQEIWRRGTAWDDEIDEDLSIEWQTWIIHLKNLRDVAIPRCYLGYSDATNLQLHIFTDASEVAYSSVLFWRTEAPNGEVNVSLVIAKARVAPLKLTSIPRLELQAAVMGARIAEAVIKEHERKPDSKVFWTDSKTVLAWIKTGSRSYKPYVAHRLAAIEESSTVNEWRWVPTKLNVADDATRDAPPSFDANHRWFRGPEFLYEIEENWPKDTSPPTPTSTEDERVNHIANSKTHRLAEGLPDVSRFSNWERLRYSTARVLQFIQLCRTKIEKVNYRRTKRNQEKDPAWNKVNKKTTDQKTKQKPQKISTEKRNFHPVTAEQLIRAEELLMRSSQQESFTEDIENITKEKPTDKDSRLRQLSVVYTDGRLTLRSRIDATAQITENVKSPMIIDGDHPTVKLWIKNVHVQLHHAGVEATVNECRQQYWVLRLRPTARTIVRRCLHCRMKTQAPPYPRTGNLPSCRLAHHRRPFTFTGLDYFGPLTVTVGRTHQKRYVAIFTCLTSRAIHLELANSLSTSSAVMALRRMVARRGCPTEIWSDNGTNLTGANKELRQAIDTATAEEAAKRTISWRFIPPGAPFMGGAWERMVRSVKTALTATLHERNPTEEVLSTLLAEAEYTVNSRPLTHVSVSADDPEALTPNHLLLGGPGRVPTPGTFDERDTLTKDSWRAAQRLADMFWGRWLREYLPELQNRREPHGRGPTVQIGDLVQIIDPNLPRNVWVRGKVVATYPGPDAVVRTVDVKTKGGILRRPVRKMVILPIEDVSPAPAADATRSHGGRDVQDDAFKNSS